MMATTLPLPFDQLSPRNFERLCLWLVEREGYERAEHLGAAGSEQGRDVTAWRDGRLWAFQCKRVRTFGPKKACAEIDKILSLPPGQRPVGLVFIVTCDVSAKTRKRARDHLGDIECHFWTGSELDQKVKQHPDIVREFFQPLALTFAPPSIPSLLHQLPPPPADFTGREDELAKLCAAIQHGGVTISGVHGMGGIGKTVLALELAQRLAPDYPDAQILIDLKGTDPDPLVPTEAMAQVVRAYHPAAPLPDTGAELAALYRSVLHGQQGLLLMDNAAAAEQVEPLLPPSSCLLLVTSRRHFTLPGLRPLNLDTLPAPDARALLLKIAPRIGDDCAAEIAALCDCLPLALRLAASALAERIDLSPSAYLDRLRDAQTRLGLVDASLSLSYDLLGDDLRRLWCQLSVFPSTFDAGAAAVVWGLEPDPAQDALSELLRYSLVEWNPDTARYRLHDLVGLFAASRLTDADCFDSQRLHAWYYAAALRTANELYLQGHESVGYGLALFDREWDNIQTGQAWAAENASGDDSVAELCDFYPHIGAHCLDLRLHPRERIRWREAALDAARRLKKRDSQYRHLGGLGNAYRDLGQLEQAIEHHRHVLQIAQEFKNRAAEGTALANLGHAYADLRDLELAICFLQQALEIARETGDRRAEGARLGSLGNAYLLLRQIQPAIQCYQDALQILQEIGDRRAEGVYLGNLANAHHLLGNVKHAIHHYDKALAIAREIGDRLSEATRLGNLGSAYEQLGEVSRSIEYYELALSIAREINNQHVELTCLVSLATGYRTLGDLQQATEYSEQANQIVQAIGDRRGEGDYLHYMSLFPGPGEIGQAIGHCEQALQTARQIGDRYAEGIHLHNLGNVYYSFRKPRRAIQHYEQALQVAQEISDRLGQASCLGSLANAYHFLGEVREAIQYYERALQIAREVGDRRLESFLCWNLGLLHEDTDPARAADLMQVCVDYEREIGHPDAEPDAQRVRAIRARLTQDGSS
jgi:tetratricopeptide (TPR) repeat protein